MAPNPILETHFFELEKNVVCKNVIFMWAIYALWNDTSSDQLDLEEKVKNRCQRDPYQNGCRHLAENFLGKPQFFCVSYMGTVEG